MTERIKASDYRKEVMGVSNYPVIIGVDPGVNTGVAIGSNEDPTIPIDFKTVDFWEAYDLITGYSPHIAGIVIEVPNSKRFLYARKDGDSGGRGRERMAANVGSNRREAELLASRLESLGYAVKRVTPTKAKWKADELKRKTGITARTNEHVRDAIRMVWEVIG